MKILFICILIAFLSFALEFILVELFEMITGKELPLQLENKLASCSYIFAIALIVLLLFIIC